MRTHARDVAAVPLTFGVWTLAVLDAIEHGLAPAGPWPPAAMAAMAAAMVLAAACAEAALYGVAWRALGHAFPVRVMAARTYALSTLEVLALALVREAHTHPDRAAALALFAGSRAWPRPPADALAGAFAGAGLIALARMALLADAHARAAGATRARAALVVGTGWLLTRLVLWWTVDLLMAPPTGLRP